jgi:hypothetical protein
MVEEYAETGSLLDNIRNISLDRMNLVLFLGLVFAGILVMLFIYYLFTKFFKR